MGKLDENRLAKLHTAGELLDDKYGEVGTESRIAFQEKSIAWYYGKILRDRRKELKITQQELAEKAGTARSYIARVEKGETDIQISSFFRIARSLGIVFISTRYLESLNVRIEKKQTEKQGNCLKIQTEVLQCLLFVEQ